MENSSGFISLFFCLSAFWSFIDGGAEATISCPSRGENEDNTCHDEARLKKNSACSLYMGLVADTVHSDSARELGLFAGRNFDVGEMIHPQTELAVSFPDGNLNEWSSWQDVFYPGSLSDTLLQGEGATQFLHHWFLPGVSSLTRCAPNGNGTASDTSVSGVNIVHGPPMNFFPGESILNISNNPFLGSYSQRHAFSYFAIRPIGVGEELFVSCTYDIDDGYRQYHEIISGSDDASATPRQRQTFFGKTTKDKIIPLPKKLICLDNFNIKPSTLNSYSKSNAILAGFGAFTKKAVSVGEIIATTPVLHFDRSQVNMIEQFVAPIECTIADGKEGEEKSFNGTEMERNDSECSSAASFIPSLSQGISYRATSSPKKRSSSQLILNYCYGHPDSQVLLLPLGPGVNYINHHDDKFKVNAYMRWSVNNGLANATYLHSLPGVEALDHDMRSLIMEGNNLMVDIVALRSIQEGEEVFLSYGQEWSEAWKDHLAHRSSAESLTASGSISAANFVEFEKQRADSPGFFSPRTIKEQEDNPYPDNLKTGCYFRITMEDQIDKGYSVDPPIYKWSDANRGCLRPCDIIERHVGTQDKYLVRAKPQKLVEDNSKCFGVAKSGILVSQVPSDAITILDEYYTSPQDNRLAFRHEIRVPPGFFPGAWMLQDPKPHGDFLATPLKPGEVEVIRWADTGEIVTPNAYRAGLPPSLRSTLLTFCEKMGIIDIFKHVTIDGNGLNPGSDTHLYLGSHQKRKDNQKWFLQRPASEWRSNLHWLSPSDSESQNSYLETLSAGGFDQVLDGIGRTLGMDGLVAFHITFIAVSHSIKGFIHHDVTQTDAKVFNVIIPLLLAEETGPELDIGSNKCDSPLNGKRDGTVSEVDVNDQPYDFCVGRYRYEHDVASLMGDDAFHGTSAIDYRGRKEMRMAATVYVADLNENNVDSTMNHYTQAYPPKDRDLILSWSGKHWLRTGGQQLPRPRPGNPIFIPQEDKTQ